MDMRKRFIGISIVSLLAAVTTGCPKETPTPSGPPGGMSTGGGVSSDGGGGGSKKFKIAVIPKGTAHSFWQSVKSGAEAAGEEEHVEIVWQGPDKENDITSQINVVQAQV